MSYKQQIESAIEDPRSLEQLYRQAQREGRAADFAAEITRRYAAQPDNVLLAAWHYRLHEETAAAPHERSRRINWLLAIPLGLILGVVYWFLLDEGMVLPHDKPYLFFLWAPLAAMAIIAFVTLGAANTRCWLRAVPLVIILLALVAYSTWAGVQVRNNYVGVSAIHLPLLAWIAIGLCVAGPGSDDRNRFAFLIKSAEAVVTGGIFAGAAGLFTAVTFGLFAAIGITFSEPVTRVFAAAAGGLTPLLAVATVYDPAFAPIEQRFEEGISRLIFALGRFFLPLTLVVGVVYVLSTPFNFWKPFEERDVLIIYNLMLFAVMGLLIFATPVVTTGLSQPMQLWLRRGMVAVAVLAVLVSLYALSATAYRTWQGGFTINRVTIIGWNVINIGILVHLVYTQARGGLELWLPSFWRTCRLGMIAYTVWALFVIVVMPWPLAA